MPVETPFNADEVQSNLEHIYRTRSTEYFLNDGLAFERLFELYRLRHFLAGTEELVGEQEHLLWTPSNTNQEIHLSYVVDSSKVSTVGVDLVYGDLNDTVELLDFQRTIDPRLDKKRYQAFWAPKDMHSQLTGSALNGAGERIRVHLEPLDRRTVFLKVYEAHHNTPIVPSED